MTCHTCGAECGEPPMRLGSTTMFCRECMMAAWDALFGLPEPTGDGVVRAAKDFQKINLAMRKMLRKTPAQ